MKIIKSNIFFEIDNSEIDVVVHGCNCFCNMGAGIALDIKNKYPEVYLADMQTKKGDREKLGTYSYARIQLKTKKITIINAYTQYHWNGIGTLVNYDALRMVFQLIKKQYSGKTIVYPKIGAGLAKGNWEIIKEIIDEELSGEQHYCIALDTKKPLN